MNRLNPLHLLIVSVVLLAFVVVKLNSAKEELRELNSSYTQTVTLAQKIKGLKASYFDKNRVQRRVNQLLRSYALRSVKITKRVTHSSVLLESKSMDIRSLNFLLGKILNGNYVVSELEIKKLSDKKASLKLEIRWSK